MYIQLLRLVCKTTGNKISAAYGRGGAQPLEGRGSTNLIKGNHMRPFRKCMHVDLECMVQLEQDVGCTRAMCDRSPLTPNSPHNLLKLRGRSRP